MLPRVLRSILLVGLTGLFASSPSSTNYTLKSYDFGTGGGSLSSSNYQLNAETGATSGALGSSTNYGGNPGEPPTQNANVPTAPTWTNPSNEYNRLKLVINTASNPTDTKYEVAISTDNFVTTDFVQSDNSVASSADINDYQTYTAWGGASGVWVVGLTPNTTYKVKVRALQGNFSGSAYGPVATAATVLPSITFSVATTLTSTPPFNIAFTSLPAGTVVDANYDALLGLTTNAMFGGNVYVRGQNTGLTSSASSYTIASATDNLTSASDGYGAIVTSASQSSGGPMTSTSPYNGVSNNVGIMTAALQTLAISANPVTSGSVTVRLKAKASNTVPSSNDYTDTLTFVAAMTY